MLISVIVPIKEESAEAAGRFRRFSGRSDAELIVASSSRSETGAFEAIGATVCTSAGSRGSRLAAAAGQARGEALFFLHADSRAPDGALEIVRAAIEDGADAGAFSLAYEGATPALRWIAWWANLRSRRLRLPYGDQGIFCTRGAYDRAGGFRDLPICDDVDFVRRLRKQGRFVVLPEKTVTSPRRYLARGSLRQVLRNWKVLAGYYAGVPAAKLERWYNRD